MLPTFRTIAGLATLSLSLFALTGCDSPDSITGTVTLNTALHVISPGGNKQSLAAGSYKSTLRITKQGGEVFVGSGTKQVTFKIPSISGATEANVSISAASMRQEFGLSGRIYETQTPFDRNVDESCVYDHESRLVCDGHHEHAYDGKRHDDNGGCTWEEVDIPGTQQVHETGYSSDKNIDINLVNTANQKIGRFYGVYNFGDTVQSREDIGGCYRSGY